MRTPLLTVLLILGLMPLFATPASAVTVIDVPLTEGAIDVRLGAGGTAVDSTLHATGPDFAVGLASGVMGITLPHCDARGCGAGATFSPGMNVNFAFGGGVTLNGVSQSVSDTSISGWAVGSWFVTADSFAMPAFGDPFTITEPFSLLVEVRLADCPTCQLRSTSVHATGAGLVTLSFANNGREWGMTSVSYALVAEPSTLLVLTLSLVGIAARRRMPATS